MWRITAIFGFCIFFYLLIIARLFYWQILQSSELKTVAAAQHFIRMIIPSERGSIITSDGFPLAVNKTAYLVFAEPNRITDQSGFVKTIDQLLSIGSATLSAMIADSNRMWVPLIHKIDREKADTLSRLALSGLGLEKEPLRYYPEASMAAQILGFVAQNENGEDRGYFGLEGFYDRELHGKQGSMSIERDVNGAPILIGDVRRTEPENGSTLVLWIDRTVQNIVEKKLKTGLEKYGAKAGSVVIMDPKTGGILAMASLPSYDPTHFNEFDKSLFKNPVVAQSYEPGSTFKTVIMAEALDERVLTSSTMIDEKGPVTVSGYMIKTWNSQYHGPITATQVVEYSSNVGMVDVAKRLGKDRVIAAIKKFGFGAKTNIDLEDEATPEMRPDKSWVDIDVATASFGQGIAVTPVQMVRSVAALANGGWLMEPHIVAEIQNSNGKRIIIAPKKVRQVVKSSTADIITEMMVAAVDNGEAKFAKPKGYRIAGKTGTAQIPVAGHYDDKKTIASFVGFAPADNPKFVMLVTLTEPTSSPWGSETAAPLFFSISRDLFLYYGIPPQ